MLPTIELSATVFMRSSSRSMTIKTTNFALDLLCGSVDDTASFLVLPTSSISFVGTYWLPWVPAQLVRRRPYWTKWPRKVAQHLTLVTAQKEQLWKSDCWSYGLPAVHSAAKIGKKCHQARKSAMMLTRDGDYVMAYVIEGTVSKMAFQARDCDNTQI